MDKKTYIAPEMEVMNIETEILMVATSFFGDEISSESQLATGSRDWDDLW